MLVDNDGNVIFPVMTEKEGDIKTKKGKTLEDVSWTNSFDLHVFSQNGTSHNIERVELSSKVVNIQDYKFQFGKNGDIIGSGFFSRELKGVNGSWFVRIDAKSFDVKQNTADVYDLKYITQFMSERQQGKAEKKSAKGKNITLSSSFTVDELVETGDGEVRMVAEMYYTYVQTYYDSKGNRKTKNHYVYNDILVVNHDGRGDVIWKETIRKRQHTQNDFGYWSSYDMIVIGDKLYFMYTDNEKNFIETKANKVHVSHGKKGTFVCVTIDNDGRQRKGRLYVIKDVAKFTLPHFAAIKESDLYLYAEKGNVYNVVKFSCE